MNGMQIFTNEQFGQVRTVTVDGEPWFVAADVCKAFGVTNSRSVVVRLDDDEKGVRVVDTLGGAQKMSIVNEQGLYHMLFTMEPNNKRGRPTQEILRCQEKLREFKRWVTHTVLPALRKTGAYVVGEENDDMECLARAVLIAQKKIDELAGKTRVLEAKVEADRPLVEFANHVSCTSQLLSMSDYAKVLCSNGLNIGRNTLCKWMRDNGYFGQSNRPYQQFVDRGLLEAREVAKYGKLFIVPFVTGKGQLYFFKKITEQNFQEAM